MSATVFRGLLFVVLTPFAASAFADSVKGEFTLEGKAPLKPVEVVAFRTPTQKTMVMLTAKPLNRARIAKSSDPESAAVNDEAVRGTDYLIVVVSADGQISLNADVGGTQYLDSTKMGIGDLVASCTINTSEHVACSVKTKKLVKFKNEPGWSIDVTFDAVVLAHSAS
jgi:hypothetical protein